MKTNLLKYFGLLICFAAAAHTAQASGDTDTISGKPPQLNEVEKRQFTQLNKLLNQGSYLNPADAEPEFTDKFLQAYYPTDTGSATNCAKAQQTV